MNSAQRMLRAVAIGILVGGAIYWWRWRHAELSRIEEVRHRRLPGLTADLQRAGFALGNPVFVRVFKEPLEFEVWIQPGHTTTFRLWKTFPIAAISGKLGPKLAEGDAQTPEGFYQVDAPALNPNSAFHLSFNIGYPNTFDQVNKRTGSWIMVHGGRASIGCFAMTDPVIEEIYLVVEAALEHGQPSFAVHVFPFRMTEERMREEAASEWLPFWENLREGYLRFEEAHVPPVVRMEDGHYAF